MYVHIVEYSDEDHLYLYNTLLRQLMQRVGFAAVIISVIRYLKYN